jgi:hypothetical protein
MSTREELGPCPICGRPMLAGPNVDRHHWIPKSEGGVAWSWLHAICHRKLHAVFTERELATEFKDAATLRSDPRIARFIAWVRKRPPDYRSRHRAPRRG